VVGELDLSAARGLANGIGLELTVPVRMVRDRIRFEDLARQPYTPPQPDTHHRNETLLHIADPKLAALITRAKTPWTLAASVGVSAPIGRTEENPFALGRLGLPHQHIQFGTGTWDPMFGASASRTLGDLSVHASVSAKATLYENSHGYRAGDRYGAELGMGRRVAGVWGASAGLTLDRENAERWSGRIEEEGNLGRTDLMMSLGVTRSTRTMGSVGIGARVPIRTWVTGEQVEYPLLLSLTWMR
jgi:hypothetical protein